ncbi:MAG TPA: hypothetical protein VKM93_07220 [Terriglobia bacterium]|nr:hypothetical protein [Terriglobia bacterium]
MPLITKPDPLPSELTYVPEDSKPHTVATGESWWTLAELPQVQAAHKSASDLCYLNFKTRDPREINWYLYHKVGCRLVTHDGKNYMFSDRDRWNKEAATPGIVYLPPVGAVLPVITPTADELRLDIWVGLGGKAGTMVAVAGIETMEGLVVGLDQPHTWMALQASINRLGVGWGVTGGVCLIVVTGVHQPSQLNGFQTGGKDFTLALEEKWDSIAKAAGSAKKFAPIIKVITQIGAKTPKALKAALKAKPDRYGDLVKAVLQFRESMGAAVEEQNVYLVDIPWLGKGAEVSFFYGVANYTALWDSG